VNGQLARLDALLRAGLFDQFDGKRLALPLDGGHVTASPHDFERQPGEHSWDDDFRYDRYPRKPFRRNIPMRYDQKRTDSCCNTRRPFSRL
jgi:hypothetical protein